MFRTFYHWPSQGKEQCALKLIFRIAACSSRFQNLCRALAVTRPTVPAEANETLEMCEKEDLIVRVKVAHLTYEQNHHRAKRVCSASLDRIIQARSKSVESV